MSNKKDIWKTEANRTERKERLAKQKDSSGSKKKIRAYSLGGRIIGILAALVIISLLAVWFLFSSGIAHRYITAATVGDTKLSVADVNTVFGMQAANPNIWNLGSVFTEQGQEFLDTDISTAGSDLKNYRDYIKDSALGEWERSLSLYEEGKREGFELSEQDEEIIQESLEQFKLQLEAEAAQYNITVATLLKSTYGPGSSFAQIEKFFRINYYSALYLEDYTQSINIPETKMEEIYQEDKDAYDMVSYKAVEFVAEFPKQVDDQTKEKVESHTEAQAEKMKKALAEGQDFFAAALENSESSELKNSLTKEPYLYEHSFRISSNIADSKLKEWLFEPARQKGEVAVIESTSKAIAKPETEDEEEYSSQDDFKSFIVVQFEDRSRQDVKPYTTRHILFRADDDMPKTDSKLEEEAKDCLNIYNSGAKTEEAFAELAKEYSKDGNASQGGLYEDIALGQFDEQYESWALDPGRKEGDVGLVKSQFGYHLIYFVKAEGVEVWKEAAGKVLLETEVQAWRAKLLDEIDVDVSKFGNGMVGKFGLLKTLFG